MSPPPPTRVGHWKADACDVYIGRGSMWGNPYVPVGWTKTSAHDVIEVADPLGAYEAHVRRTAKLMQALPELCGRVLGCWCVRLGDPAEPARCHGHVLARMANDPLELAEHAALARMRARWAHPPVDLADIEERVAVRLGPDGPEARVLRTRNAARLFVRGPAGWSYRYVHGPDDVDPALDWILADIANEAAKRSRKRAAA